MLRLLSTRATLAAVRAEVDRATLAAGVRAIVQQELTLQPDALALRQLVFTAHGPEMLGEQLQQPPLHPRVLAGLEVLAETHLVVVAEVAPRRRQPPF